MSTGGSNTPNQVEANALRELRSIVPDGSWVLFTPHDGMIVTPDPADIKRCIDVLTSHKG